MTINDQVLAIDLDVVIEFAVHRVILQHVCKIIGIEKIVDADDFDIFEALDSSTEKIL